MVYTSLDRGFSEPIYEDFAEQSEVTVLPRFDTESTKTVGHYNAILAEAERPRCDVFWNNEILNTLRLAEQGLLEPYDSPIGVEYPAQYRSDEGLWYGFAARARVLIVNTDLLTPEEYPTSVLDLADPQWQGRCGIAKPLFGTTASHAAVLFEHLGPEESREFFLRVKENARQEAGNKQVALAVASGELAFGLTDTDDAIIEIENGRPVAMVFPDQDEGEMGTLLIPNTLCIIKGSPHQQQARELIDYLLTAEVEARLAAGESAQFPLHPASTAVSRVAPEEPIRWMEVDFPAAAGHWDEAAEFLQQEFVAAP